MTGITIETKYINIFTNILKLDFNIISIKFKAIPITCINNITMLQNLLSKKPEYLKATMLLGDICCDLEQYKEALNVYSSGLKYSPNNYDILCFV